MKFIKLDEDFFDLFNDMDPFGLLSGKMPVGRFAMGLFFTDPDTEYDYPVGLAVCSENPASLIIDWMTVLPEFRGHSLGSEMLSELVRLATRYEKKAILADLNYCPARELMCIGERIFFMQYGFVAEEKNSRYFILHSQFFTVNENPESMYKSMPSYDFDDMTRDLNKLDADRNSSFEKDGYKCFKLADLEKSMIVTDVPEHATNEIKSISDLNIQQQVKVLNRVLTKGVSGNVILNQTEFDFATIDIDSSCVVCDSDGTDAILLICEPAENTVVIRKFIISSDLNNKYIAYILKHSYNELKNKYSDDCEIFIPENDEKSDELFNLLQTKK